jgi:hypothetical protein
MTRTVPFGGANRPRVVKMTASQSTTTTTSGMETELPFWATSSHRVSESSPTSPSARPWRKRWRSSAGWSPWMAS